MSGGDLMKYLLLILFLVSISTEAKEWTTNYFSLDLPESMIVETNKERRLLAFSKDGPHSPPFLSIEFGKEIPVEAVLENINESLIPLGGKMVSEECKPDCEAFYYEQSTEIEGKTIFMYHYLVRSPQLAFVISYTDTVSLESGRDFVKNIGSQIRATAI
jgi:hypothetical protein